MIPVFPAAAMPLSFLCHMQADNARTQRNMVNPFETRRAHFIAQGIRRGEFDDAPGEVGIGTGISGKPADDRQYPFQIEIVDAEPDTRLSRPKFQDTGPGLWA